MRIMWIKRQFLQLILSGQKTVEVRVLYPNLRSLSMGEVAKLNNNRYPVRIKDIRKYRSFESLMESENPTDIVPGASMEKLLALLKALYPAEKERLGVVAVEFDSERCKGRS